MRTLGYDLQQEFDFANGKRVPREFVARNAIEVRVDDVARAGELLDVAVQSGATVDRRRPLRPAAIAKAPSARRCGWPSPTRARAPRRRPPAPGARSTA